MIYKSYVLKKLYFLKLFFVVWDKLYMSKLNKFLFVEEIFNPEGERFIWVDEEFCLRIIFSLNLNESFRET